MLGCHGMSDHICSLVCYVIQISRGYVLFFEVHVCSNILVEINQIIVVLYVARALYSRMISSTWPLKGCSGVSRLPSRPQQRQLKCCMHG